ncbi:MAG: hypothetical protein LBP19_07990 [Treponema sp.]|jgi:hypothetical protein|nr:hypothetical protein [Treponema sp.]
MSYKRTIDLMDESISSRASRYAQKKNPKESLTKSVPLANLTNDDIIQHVITELSGTLGAANDSSVS